MAQRASATVVWCRYVGYVTLVRLAIGDIVIANQDHHLLYVSTYNVCPWCWWVTGTATDKLRSL